MQKYIAVFLSLVFVLSTTSSASAHHQRQVLGTSDTVVSLPPTVEGPGALLPDSPFYFLDTVKQQTRLFLAITPENRAKIHKEVAGERLAELRVMLAKQNEKGIQTALEAIGTEYKAASTNLQQAQLSGRDVSDLAKTINTDMKAKLETLDVLEAQTQGEMEARVQASTAELLTAKVRVEDTLDDGDLQQAIQEDLERKAHKELEQTTSSVENLHNSLQELQKQATDAAERSQKNREEAIKKAIAEHNTELEKASVAAQESQKKKETEALRLRQELAEQTKKTMEEAKKTAQKFKEAKEMKERKAATNNTTTQSNTQTQETVTPTSNTQ